MRVFGRLLLTLGAAILSVSTAQAGVYNPGESDDVALYPDFIGGPPGAISAM